MAQSQPFAAASAPARALLEQYMRPAKVTLIARQFRQIVQRMIPRFAVRIGTGMRHTLGKRGGSLLDVAFGLGDHPKRRIGIAQASLVIGILGQRHRLPRKYLRLLKLAMIEQGTRVAIQSFNP